MYNRAREPAGSLNALTRLPANECIEQYNMGIQSKWSHVVVVIESGDLYSRCELEPIPSNATQLFAFWRPGIFWQKGESCHNRSLDNNATPDVVVAHTDRPFITIWAEVNITFPGSGQASSAPQYPIEYSLALEAYKSCRLQISELILIVMIVCNTIKLLAIVCTLQIITEDHLVTLGDAIASFLKVPDTITVGYCLRRKRFFQENRFQHGGDLLPRVYRTRGLRTGKQIRLHWFQAAPLGLWILLLAL